MLVALPPPTRKSHRTAGRVEKKQKTISLSLSKNPKTSATRRRRAVSKGLLERRMIISSLFF